MITKADLAAVNEFMNAEASVGTNLTPDLAGGASRTSHHAEPGASKLPAPGAPSGAGHPSFEQSLLLTMAAENANVAALALRNGMPALAAAHLRQALQEIELAARGAGVAGEDRGLKMENRKAIDV